MRTFWKASIAAAAVTLLSQATASAAPYAYHGSDRSWTNGATRIWVQDREADGNGVHAEYLTRAGGRFTVGDPNGSADGAGTELSEDGSVIVGWRTCESSQGCGAWVS